MLVSFQSYLTGVVTGAVNCSPGMLLPEMTSATSSDVGHREAVADASGTGLSVNAGLRVGARRAGTRRRARARARARAGAGAGARTRAWAG